MIKQINTEEDNEKALAAIEILWDAKPNTKEGDELDKLVTLVLAYENKHYPIPSDTRKFLKKKLFIPYLIPAIFILIILIGSFSGCDIVKCYPEYDINGKIVGVACGGEM